MGDSNWTPGREPNKGTLIDSWVCESKIGEGAFGRVYAVVHKESGAKGALKMRWPQEVKGRRALTRGALAQLKFEVIGYRHLSDVDSCVFPRLLEPQVCDIPQYASRLPDTMYYFVMERLGTSLKKSPASIMTEERLGFVGEELVRGLRVIHSKGLVNKDINPDNLCWGLTDRGEDDYTRVCMIDLGMLQYTSGYMFLGCDEGKPDFTGTRYMAGAPYSFRDDLEAVGLTLAHLHGTRLPWAGKYPMTRKATKKEIQDILDMRRMDPTTYLNGSRAACAIAQYLRRIQELDVSTPIDYEGLLGPFTALRPPPSILSDWSKFLVNWMTR